MFINKVYKDLGGKYTGDKTKSKLLRWRDEEWIQIIPYIESGEKIACGSGANKKACRPLLKIDDKTPITIDNLIK